VIDMIMPTISRNGNYATHCDADRRGVGKTSTHPLPFGDRSESQEGTPTPKTARARRRPLYAPIRERRQIWDS